MDRYFDGMHRDSSAFGPDFMHNETLADMMSVDDQSEQVLYNHFNPSIGYSLEEIHGSL